MALLIVFIRVAFGSRYDPLGATVTWGVHFALMIGAVSVMSLLKRRWRDVSVLLIVAGAFGAVVWFVAPRVMTSVICMRMACVYPVAP